MDMDTLMAQAKQLQDNVATAQNKLGGMRVKGLAKGGTCIVDMSGKYDIIGISINPTVIAQGVAATEEAVLSALQDAKDKADELIDKVMSEATAGMQLPQ